MPTPLTPELGDQAPTLTIRRLFARLLAKDMRRGLARAWGAVRTARFHHLAHWVRSWIGRRNPFREGMPWLSWPCIDYLETVVKRDLRVFEYGGGGSTIFFLSRECHVTTVEGDPKWGEAIQQRAYRICAESGRFELRLVDITGGNPAAREAYVTAVISGSPWDLILIDGAARLECLAIAKDHLQPDGIIVFDNTDLPEYSAAYSHVPDFERIIFHGLGYGRRVPTTTEVFRRRCGPSSTLRTNNGAILK